MKNLFADFNSVSSKQWKQKIQFELNGADYNETLIWNSPEDIQVKPFYHKDEFEESYNLNTKAAEFKICQNIFVHDLAKSNLRALDSINRGAESIRFTIEDENTDVAKLLENLPLEKTTIYFNLGFLSIDFVKKIDAIAKEKNATIYCNLDPIGQLAKEGNWFKTNEKNNFETLNILGAATTNNVGPGGRDHWPDCYSFLIAGGGVRPGQVFGESDRFGAYPKTSPVHPYDLISTIYHGLGIDPDTAYPDTLNRPRKLVDFGKPILELF